MHEIEEILSAIQDEMNQSHMKYIVLDDDPTGSQCCNDVYVYFTWGHEQMKQMLQDGHDVSFLLTNSRSLSVAETVSLHTLIMKTIVEEAKALGIAFQILSRSDSTLRWNYPSEIDAISTALAQAGIEPGAEIICPCFIEGGRITRNDIHYAFVNDGWLPVGKTEFAKDPTFAYQSSDLKEYICEKRKEDLSQEQFISISEEELENESEHVLEQILFTKTGQKIIVNATTEKQLAFFTLQYVKACRQGHRFLYRGGSSLLRFLMKNPYIPFLEPEEMYSEKHSTGGLIVAGSHVEKTTKQLAVLQKYNSCTFVIFHQKVLLESPKNVLQEIQRCAAEIETNLKKGINVCYMTDRKRIDLPQKDGKAQLDFAMEISNHFLSVVGSLHTIPSFVIGKGGITSCELGKRIMNRDRVKVAGQIVDGVTVWNGDEYALFPNIPYIVFPGNVGSDETLLNVVNKMQNKKF